MLLAGCRVGPEDPAVEGMPAILETVLPVYFLVLGGALARWTGLARREHDEGILHLVIHVLYPCFILDNILGSEDLREPGTVFWAAGLGFLGPVVGWMVAWGVAGLLGYERGNGKRTFALGSGIQNFGYTAIPVIEQMWAPGAMAVLFVHNLGVEIALWSVGVMLISGDRQVPWRRLLNGPLIAVGVGLGMIALGWDEAITGAPRQAMHWLGLGSFPLAIFIAGALMMDMVGKERLSLKASLGGCAVRLALVPAVILAAAKFLPVPVSLKQVLLVQAAMPAALTPVLLAKIHGGRPGIAVQVVLATTLVSFITLPLILVWGRAWLGL